MRNILLALVLTGFALVVFFTIKPQFANLIINPENPATGLPEEEFRFEPAAFFPVFQGGSAPALVLENNYQETVSFSLAHEHAYLTLKPQVGKIAPGSSKEIAVHVCPECPTGEIELTVYLRAEVEGSRFGMDTVLYMDVIPGELSLNWQEDTLEVLLNGEPAPNGTLVSYRLPDQEDWEEWGELPQIDPPGNLDPGSYEFEFKAVLGSIISAIEKFYISIKTTGDNMTAEKAGAPDQPESKPPSASNDKPAEQPKPAEPPKKPDPPVQPAPEVPETWKPHSNPVRQGYTAYRLNVSGAPASGTFYFQNFQISPSENSPLMPDGAYVRINVGRDGLGQYFDWSANVRIREVLVSGGPIFNFYSYSTPVVGDYYLHAPVIPGSKLYYDIQHITFYYGEPIEP